LVFRFTTSMCVVNFLVSKKRDYRGEGSLPPLSQILYTTWKAIPALMLPVIILGGMRAGWFTPTEASVVAVFYAMFCGKFIYRTLEWKALPDILSRSALMTASILLIIALPFALVSCNGGENGGGVFAARTPTFKYVKAGEGGCGHVHLFKESEDKREFLLIRADKKPLGLPEKGSKEFDLAKAPEELAVQIELWTTAPKFIPYCNCVRDSSKLEATWKAKAGKITITLHDPLAGEEGPVKRYKASAKLERVVFEDDAGRKATLKEETITEVIVGWFAG